MRKLIVSFLVLSIFSSVVFAQTTEAVTRSITTYFDNTTFGNIDNPGGIFGGNEFEVGAAYNQNFATVPWLTMQFRVNAVFDTITVIDSDENYIGNSGFRDLGQTIRGRAALIFGQYGFLSMDTRGLMAIEVYSPRLDFGAAGSLGFNGIVELFAIPLINDPNTAYQAKTVLDVFVLEMAYSVPITENFSYSTKLAARFQQNPVATDAKLLDQFIDDFRIRWENQLNWSVTSELLLWGRVRYEARNLANDADLANIVYLQGGLSYYFDVSKK